MEFGSNTTEKFEISRGEGCFYYKFSHIEAFQDALFADLKRKEEKKVNQAGTIIIIMMKIKNNWTSIRKKNVHINAHLFFIEGRLA